MKLTSASGGAHSLPCDPPMNSTGTRSATAGSLRRTAVIGLLWLLEGCSGIVWQSVGLFAAKVTPG